MDESATTGAVVETAALLALDVVPATLTEAVAVATPPAVAVAVALAE